MKVSNLSLALQDGQRPLLLKGASQADAGALATVPDLLTSLQVSDEVWSAFLHVAGDPGNDLRLVAAMCPLGPSLKSWELPCCLPAIVLPPFRRLKWGWCGAMPGGSFICEEAVMLAGL